MRPLSSSLRSGAGRWLLAAGLGLLAAALAPSEGGGAPRADTSPVIAKVGTVTITAADLERRMAALPPFQLRTFGDTPAEIKRAFLDRVLVREALLSQGAAERGIPAREDVKERIRGVLRGAMLARLRNDAANANAIDENQIKAYYDANAAKFHSPERIALWVIATEKREEAEALLKELRKDPTPQHWIETARAHSVDGATAMRGGNLGFVSSDGTTAEPGLKVSRAILDAVDKVKDTEIVPEPVEDARRWMIVWRRQTMKPVDRPVELEASSIKQMLVKLRTEARIKDTITALRKEHLGEDNPDLLDLFDITPQGELTPVRRPGALPLGRRLPPNPVPAPGTLR
jgi:peptidyl-prolyl cis-trans isomerase C